MHSVFISEQCRQIILQSFSLRLPFLGPQPLCIATPQPKARQATSLSAALTRSDQEGLRDRSTGSSVRYTASSGEESHTPTGRPARRRRGNAGPAGRPAGRPGSERRPPQHPRARGAATGAGHAPAQSSRRPREQARPRGCASAGRPARARRPRPRPASRQPELDRNAGPRARRRQGSGPPSPPLRGGDGGPGSDCGAQARPLGSRGPGLGRRVSRAAQTPACRGPPAPGRGDRHFHPLA